MNGTKPKDNVALPTNCRFSPLGGLGDCVMFAFTQTLNNKLFQRKSSEQQYDQTHEHLVDVYRSVGVTRLTVVSELTQNADVHYHGMFELPRHCLDQVNYKLKNRLRKCKFFGFSKFKVVDDFPGWSEYIAKDLRKTYELLGRRPIVMDDFQVFPEGDFRQYGIQI